jgi:MoxR-like ATPase
VPEEPASVAEVKESLAEVGYLADEPAALVSYLAQRLGKPILVEGPAGVGKTELAKALSRSTGRELIRLQCYEGLDETKALYEWNYRKQLLRIQAEAGGDDQANWEEARSDIFGEEFLLTRPLLEAIASEEAVVLLIDEIDKTDLSSRRCSSRSSPTSRSRSPSSAASRPGPSPWSCSLRTTRASSPRR